MDLNAVMESLRAAFLSPLQTALGGVQDVAMGLILAAVPLCVGISCIRAAAGANMPVGALVDSFLVLGVSAAAASQWVNIINITVDQIHLMGSVAGSNTTDPFEMVVAGAALGTLSFEHADSAGSLFNGWGMWALFMLTGIILFLTYLGISALSLLAWVEYWAAAVILGPMTAFLPIAGFTNAGFVPFSHLISSTARIVAISLVASYGSSLIGTYALPGTGEAVTYGHAFAALGIAVVLLAIALVANGLILGILMGRPGFSVGLRTVGSAISNTASAISGSMGRSGGGGGGGSSSGSGSGSSGSRGSLQSTSTPVTSSARP